MCCLIGHEPSEWIHSSPATPSKSLQHLLLSSAVCNCLDSRVVTERGESVHDRDFFLLPSLVLSHYEKVHAFPKSFGLDTKLGRPPQHTKNLKVTPIYKSQHVSH
jgi:hypothetical protein